jgi:glycosyltransferase involved in cell wall biosynthesis
MAERSAVVYVSYDGMLEPLGQSQVLPYVEGLAARGFPMSLLSFEKPADLASEERRLRLADRLGSKGIQWTPLRYHRTPSLPATAFDVAHASLRVLPVARRTRALIHARSYVAGVIGLTAKRASNAALLFDMRGFWVDERLEAGIWRADSHAAQLARRAERALLRESDAIVTLTARGRDALASLSNGRPLPPATVVPTCVDVARFAPAADAAAQRLALGLPEGPLVIYAGSLTTWYLPELIVATGAAFAQQTGGTFVMLTRELDSARSLTRHLATQPVIRAVPFDEMPAWLSCADAGLAFVRAVPSKRASAPTKIGEYLAAGLAVAATAGVGDLDAQLTDSDVAFTTAADSDPSELAARLARAAAQPGRSERARALARRHYGLEEGIDMYARLYEALGVRPHHG